LDKTKEALEKLHDDYRLQLLERDNDDEIVRIHTEENNDGC
tara:strand:+ start:116 stop:238 length:123 start_codon:yes stop_codon:yes gene_type:complete